MSNVKYRFSEDGLVAYGELASGQIFVIDADMVEKIRTVKFYLGSKGNGSQYYVIDCKGRTLHDYLFEHRPGYEIDHINLDTFDNRRCNIRYCTHQQNQMNQPLQKNNTSANQIRNPLKPLIAQGRMGTAGRHIGIQQRNQQLING